MNPLSHFTSSTPKSPAGGEGQSRAEGCRADAAGPSGARPYGVPTGSSGKQVDTPRMT